jgi:ferredoxin-NADP reductase
MKKEKFDVVVHSVEAVSDGIKILKLLPDGDSHIKVEAGSHVILHLPNGISRKYSLCNGPSETGYYVIAVKKDVNSRGGSKFIHENIKAGDILVLEGPFNDFRLVEHSKNSIFLSGGIGATPLISMAKKLILRNSPFVLEYFVRSQSEILTPLLTAFKGKNYEEYLRFNIGMSPIDVEKKLRSTLVYTPETHVYICGPTPFMDLAINIANEVYSKEFIHFEFFSGKNLVYSVDNKEFVVRCARSAIDVVVAADDTIANALIRNGVHVDMMCEQGACGTCVTSVLDGIPDHKDVYLNDNERANNNIMTICCSRSKTPILVLDI